MKQIILLLLWLLPITVNAKSIESLYGGITQHFDNGGAEHFKTKLNKSGTLIFNPMYGVKVFNEQKIRYTAVTGFVGNNSVGLFMAGATYSIGVKTLSDHVLLGGIIGAYGQSDSGFKRAGVVLKNMPKIGDTSIIPIIGAEVAFKLQLTNKVYIKQNNVVTPLLYTGSMSLGINY